jgi:hypothetical protein
MKDRKKLGVGGGGMKKGGLLWGDWNGEKGFGEEVCLQDWFEKLIKSSIEFPLQH